MTKKLGYPKGQSENNFLTLVIAKRLENVISVDLTEREDSKYSGSIPLFKLLQELGTALSDGNMSPKLCSAGDTGMGTTDTRSPVFPTSKAILDLD